MPLAPVNSATADRVKRFHRFLISRLLKAEAEGRLNTPKDLKQLYKNVGAEADQFEAAENPSEEPAATVAQFASER